MIHIMILAVYGWFLLIPPAKQVNMTAFEVDEKAPYAEWKQRSAFDTAKECELRRETLFLDSLLAVSKKSRTKTTEEPQQKTKAELLKELEKKPPKERSKVDVLLINYLRQPSERNHKQLAEAVGEQMAKNYREASDDRRAEMDKALEDYVQDRRWFAGNEADSKARCISSDVLTSSQPKK